MPLDEGVCVSVRVGQVCAYANNQHQLGKDIGSDPRESSFYQALVLCEGVLVVLDAKATPFTRIWCAFEEAIAVTMDDAARPGKGHFLLDIATVPSGNPEKAELLTDGLSPEEQKMEAERRTGRGGSKESYVDIG